MKREKITERDKDGDSRYNEKAGKNRDRARGEEKKQR